MPDRVIDFHAHAFPDAIAGPAMAKLLAECSEVHAYLDGRLSSLIRSMDDNNIEKAVLCCIATRPEQFESILRWCGAIVSERIIPFPSIHPLDPKATEHIREIANAGYKGIKMHPYYQDFNIDDPSVYGIWKAISEQGLVLTLHTGYDFAYEWIDKASPRQIARVIEDFPELKLVTTHLGGWQQWDDVRRYLIGRPVYMEVSFAVEYLGAERTRKMMLDHLEDYLLFGSDSPWTDQKSTKSAYEHMALPPEISDKFFYGNALRLLS